MDIFAALNMLLQLTNTLSNIAESAGQVSAIIKKANEEGRTTLTADEWSVITKADDAGRQHLIDAISRALGKTPAS